AVAVVVEPVADLGVGLHELHAGDHACDAVLDARGADALVTRVARGAAAGIAVVDLAVAVVVLAVAHLDVGGQGVTDVGLPVLAGRHDVQALAEAAADRAKAVVDLAVAVVVDAVAGPGGGEAGPRHLRLAGPAVLGDVLARAAAADRGAEAVVDLAVAVVVEGVARLGGGEHLSHAGAPRAAGAGLLPAVAG